jgi:hypothetical protein
MNSGAMKLAADAAPDSEEVAAVSEEAPLSEVLLDSELTPNSIEPLDSVEMPPDKHTYSIYKSWPSTNTQKHDPRNVILVLTSTMWFIFLG